MIPGLYIVSVRIVAKKKNYFFPHNFWLSIKHLIYIASGYTFSYSTSSILYLPLYNDYYTQ